MEDVRYSELLFLQSLAKGPELFCDPNGERSKAVGLSPIAYVEMAATLLEDLYVRFHDSSQQLIVAGLRGEVWPQYAPPDPRAALHNILTAQNNLQRLCITYRGLRRIEELRDLLKRDRILEPFGVLPDLRYFNPDLEEALLRGADTPVSVIYADLDNFKTVNTNFGHSGGDVVMKAYLEVIRDSLGLLGTGYRGRGDETVSLVVGQGHRRVVEIAETIRNGVESLNCEYKGSKLPEVTTSIGVASTPPENRTADIETLADQRNQKAKDSGKNRVVAA